VTKYFNVALKGALGWNQFAQAVRQFGIMDFNVVKPLT
jgi:hypothetical protein